MTAPKSKNTKSKDRWNCVRCAKELAGHDTVQTTFETETLILCTQCFNAEIAKHAGIEDFDNSSIDPISIVGADGINHEFHFQTRLLGDIVSLEAFEVKDGAPAGYQFQLIADPGEERFEQLARMVKRIRSALATQYLEDSSLGLQIKNMQVQGRIEADMREGHDPFGHRPPVLVIDGKEVDWEEVGRMLMTFEGFQFKLQLMDPSEDPQG